MFNTTESVRLQQLRVLLKVEQRITGPLKLNFSIAGNPNSSPSILSRFATAGFNYKFQSILYIQHLLVLCHSGAPF